jgi:molybdopterin synthase catalytic subunit
LDSISDFYRIQSGPLSLDALLRAMELPFPLDRDSGERLEIGAIVTFSGVVRETEGTKRISHLDYEHYEGMAEKEIGRLFLEARERWPLERVGLVHRTGEVPVGEASVLVAVAAGHRAEAFEAARFLIDEMKKRVPIWKSAPAS